MLSRFRINFFVFSFVFFFFFGIILDMDTSAVDSSLLDKADPINILFAIIHICCKSAVYIDVFKRDWGTRKLREHTGAYVLALRSRIVN